MKYGSEIFMVFAVSALVYFPAMADILAAWDVEGINVVSGTGIQSGSSPYTFLATDNAAHTTGILTLGNGVNPSDTTGQYGFKVAGENEQTTLGGAIDHDHYIQFTLVADVGYRFNVASIALNAESSGTGADDIALLSDIEGFTTDAAIDSLSGRQGIIGGWDTDEWGNLDGVLANTEYQDLTTVTFRIYGWNSTFGGGITRIRNLSGNDLAINGTVEAIPEPTVIGLISLSGLGILIIRRFTF